ncbi:MAG: glycosyltransferase [Pacificimonas sp.]
MTRILFATSQSFPPFHFGGSGKSTVELVAALGKNGIDASVLSSLPESAGLLERWLRLQAKFGGYSHDRTNGHSTFRAWQPWTALSKLQKRYPHDILFIQAGQKHGFAYAAQSIGMPVLCYLRDNAFGFLEQHPDLLHSMSYIANSHFIANSFHALTGVRPGVIRPLINLDDYRVDPTGERVLFINPHPQKGVDLVLRIAEQLPRIPFLIVNGWGNTPENEAAISARLAALPNVERLSSQRDMRNVYKRARLLLAPTGTPYRGHSNPVREAWGRVVTEAQVSGIPVVATRAGGFPESVGEGGVLVDIDASTESWAAEVRALWTDHGYHSRLSDNARRHVLSRELQADGIVEDLSAVFSQILLRNAADGRG